MNPVRPAAVLALFLLAATSVRLEGQTPKDSSDAIGIEILVTSPPNSVGGVDVLLTWRNLSPKTVKYASFFVVPFNAVDDSVPSQIGRKVRATLQMTGPIAPGVESGKPHTWTGNGPLRWKNVWYNSTIVRAELYQVDIQYMDDSHLVLQHDEIASALSHCKDPKAVFDVKWGGCRK
jgi:hypothetical protein